MCTAMELAKHVGKGDLVNALDLVDAAGKTRTDEQFRDLVKLTAKLLPLERMHVCFADLDPDDRTRVVGFSRHVLIDYPLEFVKHYAEDGHATIDGTWKRLLQTGKPLIWHQIRKLFDSKEQRRLYSYAADFGLLDGFTFGARFAHSPSASVFAGACDGKELVGQQRHVAVINFLTPHLHSALSRIQFGMLKQLPLLTDREIEVINWTKYGKTDAEISLQMGVSARTVKFHVENVMHKLQASNRVQATAIALSQGLVDWH